MRIGWKTYDDWSDEALLDRFVETRDLKLLGSLYERYMHLVLGVCMKYLQNREDARDAVTHIFEKLITEIPRHEIGTFRSWLYVLTKNHCLMEIRSEKSRHLKKEAWEVSERSFMESEPELHPLDEEHHEMSRALQKCMEQLKSEQKQCIRLFYYEDRSYREIASSLGMEEKKVKSYIQNGKRNLKICMEKNYDKTG